jgi:hypothetical protein
MSTHSVNLPVKTGDDFVGEFETMNLSELKGKNYLVAVNQGDPNGVKFVCSTIRGPYAFEEMVESVGTMWQLHQHHAKVIMCQKDPSLAPKYLDANTIDYIEANFMDIVTESMLEGIFDEDKNYTCRAGVVEGDNSENPLAIENQKPQISGNIEEDEL